MHAETQQLFIDNGWWRWLVLGLIILAMFLVLGFNLKRRHAKQLDKMVQQKTADIEGSGVGLEDTRQIRQLTDMQNIPIIAITAAVMPYDQ